MCHLSLDARVFILVIALLPTAARDRAGVVNPPCHDRIFGLPAFLGRSDLACFQNVAFFFCFITETNLDTQ